MSDSLRPHELQHQQASLSITNSRSLPKLIESVIPSNHLILCRPLLLLPLIFVNIRVFSNESALRIRWPKYWTFSFNVSPSNEYPGLNSFRTDWLDLLAVQGTLKSLLQHHTSKAHFKNTVQKQGAGHDWAIEHTHYNWSIHCCRGFSRTFNHCLSPPPCLYFRNFLPYLPQNQRNGILPIITQP